MAQDRRAGFSLIELLLAVSIVGILAGLAIPNLQSVMYRARATEVAADLEVIRVAAVSFNGDQHAWPAGAAPGDVPPELVSYLPSGFSFQGSGYEMTYSNQAFPSGLPSDPTTTQLISATVTIDRDELSNAVVALLGGSLIFSVDNTHTVVINRN